MAVASLVLGIISIVFSFIPAVDLVGGILGIIGIILGAVGRKNPDKKGMATAGLVCSIIGTVLCLILYLACVGCAAGAAGAANSLF